MFQHKLPRLIRKEARWQNSTNLRIGEEHDQENETNQVEHRGDENQTKEQQGDKKFNKEHDPDYR